MTRTANFWCDSGPAGPGRSTPPMFKLFGLFNDHINSTESHWDNHEFELLFRPWFGDDLLKMPPRLYTGHWGCCIMTQDHHYSDHLSHYVFL